MKLSDAEILKRLGQGESIETVCRAAGVSRAEFNAWWTAQTQARLSRFDGSCRAGVNSSVRIDRDAQGIPHIFAESDEDLFFGFGFAVAQDRLFQLDIHRRRGAGRLAEVLGAECNEIDLLSRTVGFGNIFELDLLARTVGLNRIAGKEWHTLSSEAQRLIQAYTAGINAVIEQSAGRLPIEFDLLGYRPEPWSPVDCLIVENEFRWYLTGRFPVIVIPELARRVLGDGPLYKSFLQAELDEESILPRGSYSSSAKGSEAVGAACNDPEAAIGSNNWVLGSAHTLSGRPIVASDPHIAFDAVSCWYEVRLHGGSFDVAGMAYAGMPAVMFGRNRQVAWGCTNNICSQRDLYLEKIDPGHPGCFLHDGRWEPARELTEVIRVKEGPDRVRKIRFSRNGPIVDEVLPPAARNSGPVSLRWLGAHHGGWLTALLNMDRAGSAAEFRAAMRPWHVPTFSVVFADEAGHIGFQATGRIPIRKHWDRGYRPGWDPEHQWQGLIPFEAMPGVFDPERGWIATANNRTAPADFPYPLSGTWGDGLRARRIRNMIEARGKLDRAACAAMHVDALSLRAVRALPFLLEVLRSDGSKVSDQVIGLLGKWDCKAEPDRVGATIFEVFFANWTKTVAGERFSRDTAGFMSGGANGLSAALLEDNRSGWFADEARRRRAIVECMHASVRWLEDKLGPDAVAWQWGRLHKLPLRHFLSGRGDLAALLDHGGTAVKGNAHTVCNTGLGGQFEARSGAGYRLIAEMQTSPPTLWAIDGQSQSGQTGSPHYDDQLVPWLAGEYHAISLEPTDECAWRIHRLTLQPIKT